MQGLHAENVRVNQAYSELRQEATGSARPEARAQIAREELEQMAQEVEHSKKINSTLVTLLRYKNTELDVYRRPNSATDEAYLRQLDKLRVFETDLLQK